MGCLAELSTHRASLTTGSTGTLPSRTIARNLIFLLSITTIIIICQKVTIVQGLAFSNGSPPPSKGKASNYYSYKTFKKLGLPALAYSVVAKSALSLLRFKPKEIPISVTVDRSGDNYYPSSSPPPPSTRRRRRVAIVTGSNTGVGFETAKALVQDHGFEVIIACRSMEKGYQACQAINEDRKSGRGGMAVFVEPVDLADLESVRKFAELVNQQYEMIDVLVNNAGRNSAGAALGTTSEKNTTLSQQQQQQQQQPSLDVVFSSNFLGHFLLTNLLLDKCRRIVNLASVMHHFPLYDKSDNDDLIGTVNYWKRMAVVEQPITTKEDEGETPVRKTYGPSKLAALLFSMELNRRYGETKGIRSIAVNPGSVNSDIWRRYPKAIRYLYRLLYLTTPQGASTSLAAALIDFDPETVYLQPYLLPVRNNGKSNRGPPFPMFEMLGPYAGYVETTPRLPEDGGINACQSLFAVCEELTGCSFE